MSVLISANRRRSTSALAVLCGAGLAIVAGAAPASLAAPAAPRTVAVLPVGGVDDDDALAKAVRAALAAEADLEPQGADVTGEFITSLKGMGLVCHADRAEGDVECVVKLGI